MQIHSFPLGAIGTNCYLVSDDAGVAALIDPGDEPAVVLRHIADRDVAVRAILLTHGHYDHCTAVPALLRALPGVPVYLHKKDLAGPTASREEFRFSPTGDCRFYDEGDTVAVGDLSFLVLHTPGHSPGSVTLRCGDVLFTGDTLFEGSMGRTDLPGGDEAAIMASLNRLGTLEGDLAVCPGHMATSTLDRERASNHYLKAALKK